MCIIAGEVRRVAGTKLFVMPSSDGHRQITVYSNKVDTPSANVMCLPVPNPESIAFEKVYNDLFEDCEKSFAAPWDGDDIGSASLNFNDDDGPTRSYLRVQSHGSYDVVVVPTLDDLDRVPPGFLTLSDDVTGYLRSNYTAKESPFGVLLCKLRPGSVEYEPFAYSHALLESGKLFVPTRHYHVDISMGGAGVSPAHSYRSEWIADDWDHEIYTALTPLLDAHNLSYLIPTVRNAINWVKMPAAYQFGAAYPLRCFERIGTGLNEDLTFPIAVGA